MNSEELNKANDLSKQIKELEDFMFWCSGKREGFRKYPAAVVAMKRKWHGGVESQEYSMPERLQDKVIETIEGELAMLREELEAI